MLFFWAAIITQLIIIYLWYIDLMPYLWLNLVGLLHCNIYFNYYPTDYWQQKNSHIILTITQIGIYYL